MKWNLSLTAIFAIFLFCPTVNAANLFTVTSAGTPGNLNLTVCLNAYGPVSCENYTVSALSLTINTNVPNRLYNFAGIKINTPGYLLSGCNLISNGYCIFAVSNSIPATLAASGDSYELVTIANPGNAPDDTGFGAVSYVYQIGKYDVTIKQYADFLNAVAKTDTYILYNPNMGTDLNSAGITQSGTSGNYSYTVMNNGGNSANRPMTYVNWFNAARFANWMANGQPSGAQTSATTENGAYALNGAISGQAVIKNTINPNTDAPPTYYIPSEDEWYKAAYYDGMGNYYNYATQSDDAPDNVIGSGANQANYFDAGGFGFAVTRSLTFDYATQNYLTDVGTFSGSPSYYGTYDQNGNVDQWNDLDGTAGYYRGLRGGFYFAGTSPMKSVVLAKSIPSNSYNASGFRLASPAS